MDNFVFLSWQFVPFREYIGGIASGNTQLSQARLAKDVLAEVPEQLISFMKKRSIVPNEAPPPTHQSLAQALPSAPPPVWASGYVECYPCHTVVELYNCHLKLKMLSLRGCIKCLYATHVLLTFTRNRFYFSLHRFKCLFYTELKSSKRKQWKLKKLTDR